MLFYVFVKHTILTNELLFDMMVVRYLVVARLVVLLTVIIIIIIINRNKIRDTNTQLNETNFSINNCVCLIRFLFFLAR